MAASTIRLAVGNAAQNGLKSALRLLAGRAGSRAVGPAFVLAFVLAFGPAGVFGTRHDRSPKVFMSAVAFAATVMLTL
jgi:hypothetical protein